MLLVYAHNIFAFPSAGYRTATPLYEKLPPFQAHRLAVAVL